MILAALTAAPVVIKAATLAWSIVVAVVGVLGAIFVSTKISENNIKSMQTDIQNLKKENIVLKDNQISAEKQIARTLSSIEIKLTELTTIVSIFMKVNKNAS